MYVSSVNITQPVADTTVVYTEEEGWVGVVEIG